MRSLAFKLTLAFIFVSLAGIGLASVLSRQITVTEFDNFRLGQLENSIIERLVTHYESSGSWDGLADSLNGPARGGGIVRRNLPGIGQNNMNMMNSDYALVDQNGVVIIADDQMRLGQTIPPARLDDGIPIFVDNAQVGTLFTPGVIDFLRRNNDTDNENQAFITGVNRSLLISGLAASGLSLLLGALLAQTLTRPLRKLSSAASAIATGDLEQQVDIRRQDEIGELAQSFNRMNKELARARDLRRQMTADIAHDLRTPLSIILGHAEGLSDGVLPPTRETFDMIHDEARRLNGLIEDLRTLSLTEAGELPMKPQPVIPSELLNRAAISHRPAAKQKDISIRVQAAPDLPILNLDPDRMSQVLDNLVGNAIRYVPPGGEIRLAVRRAGDCVQMLVQDNGPGVSAVELEHLFDRFYRGDKSRHRDKTASGGSGLGLAIARSIVEAHHGRIRAESEPGKGLRFIIDLPV